MPPHAISEDIISDHDDCKEDSKHDNPRQPPSSGQEQPQHQQQNSQQQQLRRRKERKTVSFASDSDIYQVDNILNTDKDLDISRMWYTQEEYAQISMECHLIVDRMVSSSMECSNNSNNYCIRGLESKIESRLHKNDDEDSRTKGSSRTGKSSDYRKLRKFRMMNACDAVLDEQDLQRSEGLVDIELLADIYFACSYESQIDAHAIALQDQQEVQEFYASDHNQQER